MSAINDGYYGIECDIQPTKDKTLVVFHDLNLKRLAYIDKNILDCDWEYIKEVKLTKVKVDKHAYQGEIMLFEDFIAFIKKSSSKAFIEIKETFAGEHVTLMLDIIKKSNIDKNQVVIIANKCSLPQLIELRKIDKEIKLQFVACNDYTRYVDDCLKHKIDLDVCKQVYLDHQEQFAIDVDRFHQHGLEVNCWVVDDKDLLHELENLGVDYITTDSLKPMTHGRE